MNLFHLPFRIPAEQLANDEALLETAESGEGSEALVFWEPVETFVVVGYANKVGTEVNVPECEKRGIRIYRRCSGGGTVVQMPGGLNYGLILRISDAPAWQNISATNRFIMARNCAAIAAIAPSQFPQGFSVRGHTDLCVGDLKFAGNSQRRRKDYLLFHGTLLLQCDLSLIEQLLLMPSHQPEYRARRSHLEFVANLGLPADAIKMALANAWQAEGELASPPLEKIQALAREKYSKREWNYKS
jgi:lipoate-protein ligase A